MTAKSSLPLIAICMGSQSDWSTMKAAADILDQFGAAHEVKIISAHRTPTRLTKFAETAHKNGFGVRLVRVLRLRLCSVILRASAGSQSLPPLPPLEMNIQLDGYAVCVVLAALQDAELKWERKIDDAEHGHCPPNFSIAGAKLLQDDLRGVMKQIKEQD